MFSSVKEFKAEYQKRLLETYAETVDEAHIFEQYEILSKMVRDEASKYWRETRNDVYEHGKKTSCLFLHGIPYWKTPCKQHAKPWHL
jgi:glucan phosphorylase